MARFRPRWTPSYPTQLSRVIATRGDVTLKQIPLAGTDDAWTVEYDAASPVDAGQQIPFRGVSADLGDRALLIIGQAPAGGFPASDVAAALASIRIIG